MNEFSRIKMRSRRGLKELDVIFQHYLECHYPTASATEIQKLDELLNIQDPVLWDMLLGIIPVPEAYAELIEKLRAIHD
jgi:antitoxin CptB